MAEQAPARQSKRLLVVALIVAAIVVVIYNVHVSAVRSAGKGEDIVVVKYSRDMEPGERITRKDVHRANVQKAHYEGLGNVVTGDYYDLVVGGVLNQPVKKDQFVTYGHVTAEFGSGASGRLEKDMVAVSLEIDPRNALGDILRVHDRVNILARLSVNRRQLKTYRVIEGVRVVAVGGRGQFGRDIPRMGTVSTNRVPRTYRSITVQVPKKISLELENVLSHRAGSISLELCSASLTVKDEALKINEDLDSLKTYASPGRGEGP